MIWPLSLMYLLVSLVVAKIFYDIPSEFSYRKGVQVMIAMLVGITWPTHLAIVIALDVRDFTRILWRRIKHDKKELDAIALAQEAGFIDDDYERHKLTDLALMKNEVELADWTKLLAPPCYSALDYILAALNATVGFYVALFKNDARCILVVIVLIGFMFIQRWRFNIWLATVRFTREHQIMNLAKCRRNIS